MSMLRSLCHLIMVCLLSQSQLGGQVDLFRADDGVVEFTSDAPLELIKANSKVLRGAIDPTENTFAFTIDVKSFEGFNSNLQRTHFNENYLETSKYPRATFAGKIIEQIDWDSEGEYQLRAKGILDIHGVKQERIIPSKVTLFSDRVIIRSEFSVALKEHDIDIPKIVAQKISEEIRVGIEITLYKQNSN
ncbi:MAG: YceI family protein [Saprospiraceae bacterium]|nr:YceI family protein [Saprospiraceae bacterium]